MALTPHELAATQSKRADLKSATQVKAGSIRLFINEHNGACLGLASNSIQLADNSQTGVCDEKRRWGITPIFERRRRIIRARLFARSEITQPRRRRHRWLARRARRPVRDVRR